MPGRRRSRASLWTHKKSKSASRHSGDPTAPTWPTWDTLEQLGAFIVVDGDGKEHRFDLNDVAAILPPDKDSATITLEEYWMVKIKSIRSTADGEVWVQINWYYSPQDINEKIPSFDALHCAKNERIYSHHSEVISALTFEALVQMVDFLEDDPDQDRILGDQFFCRYFFETRRPILKIFPYTCTSEVTRPPSTTPKTSREFGYTACICGELYNPEDMGPGRVMHWCPRPSCRRGYHRSCLLSSGHQVLGTQPDIVCARLAISPDTDEPITLPDERVMLQLPPRLMRLAAQPIVRGGIHGIAGNVGVVVHARRIVHAAFRERQGFDSDSDSDSASRSRRIIDVEVGLDVDLDRWDEDPAFEFWKDSVVEPNLSYLHDGHTGIAAGIQIHICPTCAGAV
ncbi:hypothetical protein DFH09DRAFT_1139170 [Mycena vulgaris]|nr:hypothetical protein DFH09DRAFT_1139170 [Mycena vulgaris]